MPAPGSVARRQSHVDLGVTELELSNGMRVVYKHTRFLDDEVQFKAFAYGGLSQVWGQRFS
jgi:zinc protease